MLFPLLPLVAFLLLLNVQCVVLHGIELELHDGISLIKNHIPIPVSTNNRQILSNFKKILVKLPQGLLHPVFVGNSAVDPPFLYVDESMNIRSIGQNAIFAKFSTINREIAFKIPLPPVENHSSKSPNPFFEYCYYHLANTNGIRCHYFFVSENDDENNVKIDCLDFISPRRPPAKKSGQMIIRQMDLPKNADGKNLKCITVEDFNEQKSERKCQKWDN